MSMPLYYFEPIAYTLEPLLKAEAEALQMVTLHYIGPPNTRRMSRPPMASQRQFASTAARLIRCWQIRRVDGARVVEVTDDADAPRLAGGNGPINLARCDSSRARGDRQCCRIWPALKRSPVARPAPSPSADRPAKPTRPVPTLAAKCFDTAKTRTGRARGRLEMLTAVICGPVLRSCPRPPGQTLPARSRTLGARIRLLAQIRMGSVVRIRWRPRLCVQRRR